MRSVQSGPLVGLVCQSGLIVALAATVGLSAAGWGAGIIYAIAVSGLLRRAIARRRDGGFRPADWVTLARAILVGGITALIADAFERPAPVTVLVGMAAVALALDAVDGQVARRTHTVSQLGARFDMEVDAFLILALSVYVAPTLGGWVLAIGLARYGFVTASWVLPWLRASAPPRHWSKVVAAIQGITLTLAAAAIVPRPVMNVILLASLALLTESFGREAWWLWRHRLPGRGTTGAPATVLTVLSGLIVWFSLAAPANPRLLTPVAFLCVPLGALIIVAVILIAPLPLQRTVAVGFGVLLGLLTIVKALNIGFSAVFDRPFDIVNDWFYLGPGIGVLSDSVGLAASVAVAVAALVFAVAAMIVMPWAALRLARAVTEHRRMSVRALAALAIAWMLFAITGVESIAGVRVASTNSIDLVYGQLHGVGDDLADRAAFAGEMEVDPLSETRGEDLLAGLRGKDVILAFVESYGRSAVQDSPFSPGIHAVLRSGATRLQAAGFSSRSAFLTSPTFGGASWLAHSTLESGLWVDTQQRYNQLLTEKRLTLTGAFSRAGWRTVFDVPANTHDWPQGRRFYGFDKLYDSRNVGYRGPKFGYAPMPDQYVLSAFHTLELAPKNRKPVMAEIDLVSSHTPWTPLPRMVEWNEVGDGSIFNSMVENGESRSDAVRSDVQARYGQSVEYTLTALLSYLTSYPDPNLVVIMVGDHQPHSAVSGNHAGRDVPISIIAHDPSVLEAVSSWNWQDGLLPGPDAPVWPMSQFRERFVTAYSG